MNPLRKKLAEGKSLSGTLVSLTDPALCEIAGRVGFDCVWIDTEHTYMSYKEVLCHLNAARSVGIPTVVRLPQNDLTATKKILEMGPDGIIFPMVKTVKELRELIACTLYPPLGTRGFGPMRAIGYGATDAKEYAKGESLELCRFVQIEDAGLLEEIDELISMPYVDGYIFGPNDLSGSLGEFLDVSSPKTVSCVRNAAKRLKDGKKTVGIACGASDAALSVWSDMDFDMIFAGADWNYVYDMGRTALSLIKKHTDK